MLVSASCISSVKSYSHTKHKVLSAPALHPVWDTLLLSLLSPLDPSVLKIHFLKKKKSVPPVLFLCIAPLPPPDITLHSYRRCLRGPNHSAPFPLGFPVIRMGRSDCLSLSSVTFLQWQLKWTKTLCILQAWLLTAVFPTPNKCGLWY